MSGLMFYGENEWNYQKWFTTKMIQQTIEGFHRVIAQS